MKKKECSQCGNLRYCFDGLCNDCYRENNNIDYNKNYLNRLEISYEPEEIEEFKRNVKKKCSWCGAMLPGTIEHYMKNGNACEDQSTCKARRILRNDGHLSDIRILV